MEETSHSCANEPKKRRSKTFCVAGGPNKKSCTNNGDTPGVSMHRFPTEPAVRRQWIHFVRRHRTDFDPAKYSSRISLCSAHFDPSCFSKRFSSNLEGFNNANTKKFLTRESIPTIDTIPNAVDVNAAENSISDREKRLVSIDTFWLQLYNFLSK